MNGSGSGQVEIRPRCGLTPTRLVQDAGILTEPAPSEPTAAATSPAATATAEPPDEPPGVCSRFHGLRVLPNAGPSVIGHWPSSGVFVLPTITAPAAFSRRATSPSVRFGGNSPSQPNFVLSPARSESSLIATGTPSSAPSAPAAIRSSALAASARARPSRTTRKAFRVGCAAAIRSSARSTSSAELTPPSRSSWACSVSPSRAGEVVGSGTAQGPYGPQALSGSRARAQGAGR